jgi:hypothetical protein
LLPICNLRPKVIDINCESSVMCAAQSRAGFHEPPPDSGGAILSLPGRRGRTFDRNFSHPKSSLNRTSTPFL